MNGLWLILKQWESLEETVIPTLTLEIEIKRVLCNTIRELPVTIKEMKNKTKLDKYISEKKKEITDQQCKKIDGEKILMYSERVVIPGALEKRISKDFIPGHPGIAKMKALLRNYVFLVKYG